MKRTMISFALALVAAVICGCGANYSWRANVPKSMRSVSVPTFNNKSDVNELGAIATRQLLREFQREGTFSVRRKGDAAIEVQGVIVSSSCGASGYDRRSGLRKVSYDFSAVAEVSVIDKRRRRVMIANRKYTAFTSLTAGQDLTTAQRDASGRLAEDLARQIVDDVVNFNWSNTDEQ